MKLSRGTVAAFLLASAPTAAFQTPRSLSSSTATRPTVPALLATPDSHDGSDNNISVSSPRIWKRLRPAAAALLTATTLVNLAHDRDATVAHASAPVMAMPKAEDRDPMTDALIRQERLNQQQAQKELQQMAQQAREIEASQGERARIKFEHEFKQKQQEKADARAAGLVQLKQDLLDQGIDPFTDIEGRRQVILFEKGVDLGEIPGTPFHLEKTLERTRPKKSAKVQKAINRQVIACVVKDLRNRGIDPLDYMEKHTDKTMRLMDMPPVQAAALLQKYQANLEEYGQITVPAEGEMSVKEKMAANQDPKAAKAAEKAAKAAEKAKMQAEKARIKAEQKAEKEAKKEQARAAAQAAKEEKKAAAKNAAAAAAGAAAAAAAGASVAAGTVQEAASAAADMATSTPQRVEQPVGSMPVGASTEIAETPASTSVVAKKNTEGNKIVPFSAAFVAVGGGGYAFKMYRDKAAEDEAERQRQFKLLMGGEADSTAPPLEVVDEGDDILGSTPKAKKPTPPPAPVEATPAPAKKKGLGIKKVFGKKKNDRETDLSVVTGSGAKAPEFAVKLSKILTYGAPGRFPRVEGGDMPMEKFDLEEAKTILSEQREASGLSLEESAEVFANVVNCMLIDIVDLASSSLAEKNDDITVKSINIVVDFMNHAASLYDSIAKDVVIKPVTYGGDLSKSKLEQMYSTYTVSGMVGMFGGSDGGAEPSDDFDSRVALLQDVFEINEKKAEGLMMKAVQKNMMEMMKDGKGMEGMEEMLGGMEGMEGLAGMPGMGEDGEGPNPEQLKEMLTSLKEMKESGSIPPDEFDEVKQQFKEAFGSSLEDVVKDTEAEGELDPLDKELLDLMKAIMDD